MMMGAATQKREHDVELRRNMDRHALADECSIRRPSIRRGSRARAASRLFQQGCDPVRPDRKAVEEIRFLSPPGGEASTGTDDDGPRYV